MDKRDAFVSYSSRNSTWVTGTLVPRLEDRGFTILIDTRDFRAGAFGIDEMERCVTDARRVLVVLTPEYIDSEWTRFENIMAQSLDPAAIRRKVVPVLLESCELPLRLRILHHRDLRQSREEEWEGLFRDLI